MRWKLHGEGPDEFRCCWCFHVRTGTILIGTFVLIIQIAVFSLMSIVIVHNNQLDSEIEKSFLGVTDLDRPNDFPGASRGDQNIWWKKQQKWSSDDNFVGLLCFGGFVVITMLLIYGTLKGRPGYMTPFMGLQVFDFCMCSLSVISYFSYVTDIKKWLAEQPVFPYKDYLMSMQSDWLMLMFVLMFVGILVFKVYMMGVVWSCYKYLTQQERNGGHLVRVYDTEMAANNDDTEVLLPPKYEDVANIPPAVSTSVLPPPPYSAN
jgi:lysosomal-associated transmembrane protein